MRTLRLSSCRQALRPAAGSLAIALCFALTSGVCVASEFDRDDGLDAAPTAFERLVTRDGRELQGFVASETPQAVIFLQLIQPPGRPTYGVEQKIPRENVAALTSLSSEERLKLKKWYRRLRAQVRIEAGQVDDVKLESFTAGDRNMLRYHGGRFVLESAADEPLVRRAAVRLEQTFVALEAVLPALAERGTTSRRDDDRLLVRLFDAKQDYDDFLGGLGVAIANPALYSPDRNLLVLGSDLKRLGAETAAAEAQTRQLRMELARLKSDLPNRLAKEKQRLLDAKTSAVQTERTLQELRNKLRGEISGLSRRLDAAERKNNAVFDEATRRLFRALRHEALHAWLDRQAFPADRYDVPRWLHEGLAQVFEAGVLEAGVLRLDAANAEALAALKADLREAPLPLADLLRAEAALFLVPHGQSGEEAKRHYAYAWGLAHYLTFERRLLREEALEAYLRGEPASSSADSPRDAIVRFQELIGGSLEAFEQEWRAYVLRL